jgi:hypothetical protein
VDWFAPHADWEAIGFLFGWLALSLTFCYALEKRGGHK